MRLEPRHQSASFRVVDVIGRGLSVSFRNFFCFASLTVLLAAPLLLVEWTAVEKGARGLLIDLWWDASRLSEIDAGLVIVYFVGYIILINLLAAAVTFGAFQALRQREARVGESLGRGMSRLLPVIGTYFWVMFVAWLVPSLFFMAADALADARGSAGAALLAVIFWITAVVIFFVFVIRYFVALPAVIIEGKSVFEALSRSVEITRGCRGKFFVITIIYFVFYIVLLLIIESTVGAVGAVTYYGSLEDTGAALVSIYAIEMLAQVLASVFACVAYCELLRAEEGVDARRTAAVFD